MSRTDSARLPDDELRFMALKNRAAEYYNSTTILQDLEAVLNQMFFHNPEDTYGYLANYFMKLSVAPSISRLRGRGVYDARGQGSVRAQVMCIVRNQEQRMSSAAISSDFGFLEQSADGPDARTNHVDIALYWINGVLSQMLQGLSPFDQTGIDGILSDFLEVRYLEEEEVKRREKANRVEPEVEAPVTPLVPEKEKKGGKVKKNASAEKQIPPRAPPEQELPGSVAIGSVSLAVAKTAAELLDVPLYQYISTLRKETQTGFHVPVPLVTLLSCGKSSPGKLNLLEEIIMIPRAGQSVKQITETALKIQKEMIRIMSAASKAGPIQEMFSVTGVLVVGYERLEQPLDVIAEACANLELPLGTELHLAINCAAQELMDYSKGKYEVVTGGPKSPDELVDLYQGLVTRYPAVQALIDPLRKEDLDQWEKLRAAIGASCTLLCEAAAKPPGQAVLSPAPPPLPGVGGHVLKQTTGTSVSSLIRIAANNQDALILGATCNEPCGEDSLSDLAVGLGMSFVKLGGLAGAERLTKCNRLIAIEEELAQQGILVSREKHPPPLLVEYIEEQPQSPEQN